MKHSIIPKICIPLFCFLACLFLYLGGLPAGKEAGGNTREETPPPISDQEATIFAEEIEKSLAAKDGAPFLRAMDWEAVTDAVLRDLPENREEGKYRRKDVLESLSMSGGMVKYVVEQVKRGGTYHFLRLKDAADLLPGEKAVQFRFVDPDGGLDYHRLYLRRGPGGKLVIREIFLYRFGETFSDSIRRTLAPELYVGGLNGYGAPMSDVVQILFRENMPLIQAMHQAYDRGNYRKALDLYDALPKALQDNKSLEVLRLNAAMMLGDSGEYIYVLADLREKRRDDPCVDFLSLDYFFSKGMNEEVLRSMDRIDRLVGKDPYLNVFRCLALINLGRPEEAKKLYAVSVREDKRLADDPIFSKFAP